MANHVYIATSLDGFIATPDGSVDWLNEIPNPDGSDFGFSDFMQTIDALVMGRNTFEVVLSFGQWPYDKPVFVLSNTLKSLPESLTGKAHLMQGEPRSIVHTLNQQGYKNLYIDGGQIIQQFLQEDLIDQITLSRVPILLGEGIPLFGKLTHPIQFKHESTEILNGTLVKTTYVQDHA